METRLNERFQLISEAELFNPSAKEASEVKGSNHQHTVYNSIFIITMIQQNGPSESPVHVQNRNYI